MKFKALLVLLAAFTLPGCSVLGNATPEPLPTIVLDNNVTPASNQTESSFGKATASGVVIPAEQSKMVFTFGGKVNTVNVASGDRVEAGQVLVELAGRERLTAELESAKFALLSAQQERDDLYEDLDVKQAHALKAIADNRDAVRDAERNLYNLQSLSQGFDVDAAFANMILAKDKLERVREDFEPYENKPEENLVRAGLLSQLAQAQKEYDALVRRYNNLIGTASDIDLSQAQANLAIAQADLAKSERDYALLQDGPHPDDIALAEGRLSSAQAQLDAAELALEDLTLIAPFSGTITHAFVRESEWVTPGQPVLELSDLQNLRVETTDLSERDVPLIQVGDRVLISIRALNEDVQGTVIEISPLAENSWWRCRL